MNYPNSDYTDPDFVDTELADPAAYPRLASKRDALKERIETGRQRLAERDLAATAKKAADDAIEFTKEHPIAVVAGAIGVGLLIGAMTKPGRAAGKQVAQRSTMAASIAKEAALAFGLAAFDRMNQAASDAKQSSTDRLEDVTDTLSTKARAVKRDAAYKAEVANDAVKTATRRASRKSGRTIRDAKARLKR
jgi:hypothetical protein